VNDGPIEIRSTAGVVLQAELRHPDDDARGSAVICHPHPQEGGSKDHPLLWAIRNELAARGMVVVSFNFRGVMGSGGAYDGGVGELEDAAAALRLAGETVDGPAFVCGWSFGANVALRLGARDDAVAASAVVGIPLGEAGLDLPPLPSRDELAAMAGPVLLLAGEADPFCPVPELRSLARRIPGAETVVLPDTDHFFWRREKEAAATIGGFASRAMFEAG
jgi:hypothetical protein